MKNLWISVKITLAMCLLLGVGYVLVLRGVSALAGPNGGQAETLTLDGRVVGAANVGQQFTAKVNVLRLNIALETLQPNVTASAGVRQAGGCGEGVSPEN